MKSFTMIPDDLKIPSSGKNKAATKLMIAYLVRGAGYPGGKRFHDLTIGQLSKFVGIKRESASKLFHHIVDLWEWPYSAIVNRAYPDLDLDGFYQYLLIVQRRARSRAVARIPKQRSTERSSHNVTVDRPIMGHYKNVRRLRRLKTNDERLYSIQPLVMTESDGRDRGETERIEPSEVSTSAHDGRGRRAESEPTDDSRHKCPDWDFMEICKTDPEYDVCTCRDYGIRRMEL